MINLGHHPSIERDISRTTEDSLEIEQFLKTIKEIRAKIETVLKKTNKVMKRKWDAKKKYGVE